MLSQQYEAATARSWRTSRHFVGAQKHRSAPFHPVLPQTNEAEQKKMQASATQIAAETKLELFRGKRDDGVIRVAAFHFQELREHVFSAQNPNEHLLLAFQFRQLAAFLVVQV